MNSNRSGTAPNYTNACIVMFGVNVTIILLVLWILWGIFASILLACGLNFLLERISVWRAQHSAASIRRGKSY